MRYLGSMRYCAIGAVFLLALMFAAHLSSGTYPKSPVHPSAGAARASQSTRTAQTHRCEVWPETSRAANVAVGERTDPVVRVSKPNSASGSESTPTDSEQKVARCLIEFGDWYASLEVASVDEIREWRARLEEEAEGVPTSPFAADAFRSAGELAQHLGETDAARDLLWRAVAAPNGEPTAKLRACESLIPLVAYADRDLDSALALFDTMEVLLDGLSPTQLRDAWQPIRLRVPLRRAEVIRSLTRNSADARIAASFEDYLAVPEEDRRLAGLGVDVDAAAFENLARAYAAQQRLPETEAAFAAWRAIRQSNQPPTMIWGTLAESAFPTRELGYREFLERGEELLEPDDWSIGLSIRIAAAYLSEGRGLEFIARIEPIIDDSTGAEALAQSPDVRPELLLSLARASLAQDVREPERALRYCGQFIAEFPDHFLSKEVRSVESRARRGQ